MVDNTPKPDFEHIIDAMARSDDRPRRLIAVCRKAWECQQVFNTLNPGADFDRCLGQLFYLTRQSREAGDLDE